MSGSQWRVGHLSERTKDLAAVNSWLPRQRRTDNGQKFDLAVDVFWIKACLRARQCLACGWEIPCLAGFKDRRHPSLRALTDHITGVPCEPTPQQN